MNKKKYKFVFLGSHKFSKIVLERIVSCGYVPDMVVCNPDKPVGRKKIITSPEIKQFILDSGLNIKISQPETKSELTRLFSNIDNFDFGIVAAYSKIIPEETLKKFKSGIVGVHPSLLPKYRGPSPIQFSLLNGDKITGTTLFVLGKGVDDGPIIVSKEIKVSDFDTYATLEQKLAEMGGELICNNIDNFIEGKIDLVKQDNSLATFTRKITTDDGFVDLKKDNPNEIFNKIRALNPNPGVYAFIDGVRTKLLEVRKTKDGNIVITKVLPAGRNERESDIILENK